MFNTKRIIFLIGLLSLVTLTGALLAGPAFASKPASAHKADICHYQAFSEEVAEPFKAEEPEAWLVMWTDSKSVDKHILNHSDGGDPELGDTLISNGDHDMPAQFTAVEGEYDFITLAECVARDGAL